MAEPRFLETTKEPQGMSLAGVIFNICGTVFLLVLFNVFPYRIGLVTSAHDPSAFVPLLNPRFLEVHLAWLNAWLGLSLALNVAHLGFRRWTRATRWADLGLTLFGFSVLVMLATGPSFIAGNLNWVVSGRPLLFLDPRAVAAVAFLTRLILWLAVLGTGIGAAVKLFSLLGSYVADSRAAVQDPGKTRS